MRDADQADAWIAAKEAFLQAEESSDSLDTVETLLKNQLNFEKSLTAYEEKIKVLQQSSDQLIQQEHVDSDVISERCKEVLENWERLKKLATAKVGDLGESRKLFQFLRDAEEVSNKLFDKRGCLVAPTQKRGWPVPGVHNVGPAQRDESRKDSELVW